MVQHENLTIEEAVRSLRFSTQDCERALQLLHKGSEKLGDRMVDYRLTISSTTPLRARRIQPRLIFQCGRRQWAQPSNHGKAITPWQRV